MADFEKAVEKVTASTKAKNEKLATVVRQGKEIWEAITGKKKNQLQDWQGENKTYHI